MFTLQLITFTLYRKLFFSLYILSETENGVTKTEITSSSTNKDEGSTCKDMRVSKIYKDVTLNGGEIQRFFLRLLIENYSI